MPLTQTYNPVIIGFVEGKGYVNIPLQTARDEYGQLPSEYGLLRRRPTRRLRKTLNLSLGLSVIKLLQQGKNLPEMIARFSEHWGRDFHADFGVDMGPFHSLNDPSALKRVVEENAAVWEEALRTDILDYLQKNGLVPLSTLRAIPPQELLKKARAILAKKRGTPAHRGDLAMIDRGLALVQARAHVEELAGITGGDITRFSTARLAVYADGIARTLWRISQHLPLCGVDRLICVRGRDVELEFAPRDASFVALGKEVGDCTADKTVRQVDQDVENIYWTVFAWFLDRNYQVLKVFCDGEFVMKVHLLPLLVASRNDAAVVLTVDAIEATPMFREDTRVGNAALLERREHIFARMVKELRRIAGAMGVEHVVAERFSNTGWVRQELERFPEVYFHIEDIRKIDELEDVFEMARRTCAAATEEPPRGVFMELQMKNTFLLRGVATVRGVKAFALIAGNPAIGIPLKRVVGV